MHAAYVGDMWAFGLKAEHRVSRITGCLTKRKTLAWQRCEARTVYCRHWRAEVRPQRALRGSSEGEPDDDGGNPQS